MEKSRLDSGADLENDGFYYVLRGMVTAEFDVGEGRVEQKEFSTGGRARIMTGGRYRLFASANLQRLVLGRTNPDFATNYSLQGLSRSATRFIFSRWSCGFVEFFRPPKESFGKHSGVRERGRRVGFDTTLLGVAA